MAPEPYNISVPQEKIDKLKTKLSLAEFPDELEASEWDLGVPLADMQRLTKAWEQWDWRQAEERLNKAPQYHTGIKVDGFDELDIHFIWQKSPGPASFIEALPILPLLADPAGPAFHIVAPSLPNYGFSSSVKTRGFAAKQYAETCHKLMLSLGYNEYVTQGGDWGFFITRTIGHLYPASCKASHINLVVASAPSFTANPLLALQHTLTPYTAQEKAGLARTAWFGAEGRGYFVEQSTKPQTLAYALNDSPVALLAWVYEKLHDWTDGYKWTEEELFTWVSVYAYSRGGPGAAHRIYYEMSHPREGAVASDVVSKYIPHVKLGLAYNPQELAVLPKSWCRTMGPVVYEAENESGGHFYATEKPEYLVRDLKTMFGKDGGAYGVVEGKSGYD
ncbi:putative epoxide hydrolase [Lachnellula hyalina]|uniref:Putative epoxide hydrolase n=1 Tax=Lachnellula hyalina TaxID=1316788 RepID=A0A8H8RAW0_9HELO|nr:putative epoxide hydrolase [Lachnellula hyalina]TVY30798.1 putative epoxide hydrolase [Lachnellula hyalina]